MKRYLVTFVGLFAAANIAHAATDIETIQNLGQEAFKSLSEDLGAAASYRATSPAEHLGITGFDVAIDVNVIKMGNTDDWAAANSGFDELDTVVLPKLHVHKGLPFGIDVGAFVVSGANTDLELVGAELKYALIKGGVAKPAVAVRATYSKLSGIDQLDMDTTGVELSVSKGFTMLTPYAGVGRIKVNSEPKKEAVTIANLQDEDVTLSKVFAGVNLNMGLLNFGFEADSTGDTDAYNLKLGFRF